MSFTTYLRPTTALALLLMASSRLLAAPTVTSLSPPYGSVGETVTIWGSGFVQGDTVFFNNNVPASVALRSSGQIATVVPAGATTGLVTVYDPGGSSAQSPSNFTVIPQGPYITGFTPAYTSVGELVVVSGYHLTDTPTSTQPLVYFAGTLGNAPQANADGTSVTVRVPTGATNGLISVTTASGTGYSATPFTVIGPGPFITAFSPGIGSSGTPVTVEGFHLGGVTNMSFNGKAGTALTVTSSTRISASAPAGVTTGPIAVTASNVTFATATNFFVLPVIKSFSPVLGRAGTNISLIGSNFLGTTSVTLAGVSASFVPPTSNTNLVVIAPASVSSGQLRVFAPAGSYMTATNFKFQPVISSFSPTSGKQGTAVTLYGANLNEKLTSVTFSNKAAAFATPAFGQVVTTAPTNVMTGPISVTTSNGTFSTPGWFYYPPVLSTFTPTSGVAGVTVALTGTSLLGTTNVTFNGMAAQSFTVNGNTSISAVVPNGVTTGPVCVAAPGGTNSVGAFYAPPAITSFTPAHGLAGTNVTVTGVNFLGATSVKFNGISSSSVQVLSNSALRATVPAGFQTGPISVVTPGGTATSLTNFIANSADLAVTVTGAPDPVVPGNTLVYTITVSNPGPLEAPNVQLTNFLSTTPAVQLRTSTTSQGVLVTNANPILGHLGTINAGNSATVLLTVAPQALGMLTNRVTVGSDYPDPVPANNSATAITRASSPAVLSIELMPSNQVRVSWPTDLTNYWLEYRDDLAPPTAWLTNGSLHSTILTEPATNSGRFYRLVR